MEGNSNNQQEILSVNTGQQQQEGEQVDSGVADVNKTIEEKAAALTSPNSVENEFNSHISEKLTESSSSVVSQHQNQSNSIQSNSSDSATNSNNHSFEKDSSTLSSNSNNSNEIKLEIIEDECTDTLQRDSKGEEIQEKSQLETFAIVGEEKLQIQSSHPSRKNSRSPSRTTSNNPSRVTSSLGLAENTCQQRPSSARPSTRPKTQELFTDKVPSEIALAEGVRSSTSSSTNEYHQDGDESKNHHAIVDRLLHNDETLTQDGQEFSEYSEQETERVHTQIENARHKKHYFGGFRDKRTGIEYHHAFAQTTTAWDIRDMNAPLKFHRDAQTKYIFESYSQVSRDVCTQMDQRGYYVDKRKDKIIKPKKYVTAHQVMDAYLKSLIMVQSCARRWLANKRVARIKAKIRQMLETKAAIEQKKMFVEQKRKQKDVNRRLHPKKQQDFELLYHSVEEWRISEISKIEQMRLPEPERLAYLASVMDQETNMIQKIDRLRVNAKRENTIDRRIKMVDKMAEPMVWGAHGQNVTSVIVDTPNIVRARYLSEIYYHLTQPTLEIDERLKVLLDVKIVVTEFECRLSREIMSLLDREADLLNRKRAIESLEGLRTRIASLFYQFIKNPEFNPASKSFTNDPNYRKTDAIYFCRNCSKYLPATEFTITASLKQLGRCKRCIEEEKISNRRENDELLSLMIQEIQQRKTQQQNRERHVFESSPNNDPNSIFWEASGKASSSGLLISSDDTIHSSVNGGNKVITLQFIDIVHEYDFRHLVQNIWGGRSSISGDDDLSKLILTNWNYKQPLSPWNCILLTREEEKDHRACHEKTKIYSDEFIRSVNQRHKIAKTYFARLTQYVKLL